jgi:hypothetical protein
MAEHANGYLTLAMRVSQGNIAGKYVAGLWPTSAV